MSKPEFPRPSVGDELILFKAQNRREEEKRTPVRVTSMARFRVTLEGADGEPLAWWCREFDIRTQTTWDNRYRYQNVELHTPETLEYQLKQGAVHEFLKEHHIFTYQMRGALRKKVDGDPLAFVNLLKEWIGEETI